MPESKTTKLALAFLVFLSACAYREPYVPYVAPPPAQADLDMKAKNDAFWQKKMDDIKAENDFRMAYLTCKDADNKYPGCDVIEAHQKKRDDEANKKYQEQHRAEVLIEAKRIKAEADAITRGNAP